MKTKTKFSFPQLTQLKEEVTKVMREEFAKIPSDNPKVWFKIIAGSDFEKRILFLFRPKVLKELEGMTGTVYNEINSVEVRSENSKAHNSGVKGDRKELDSEAAAHKIQIRCLNTKDKETVVAISFKLPRQKQSTPIENRCVIRNATVKK